MLMWNPFPLQSSRVSFDYLLLPPRSALNTILQSVTLTVSQLWPCLSTHLRKFYISSGCVSVACFSAFHFRGCFIRQVSCYTLLGGFQLPWPPSCCYNAPTPFEVSDQQSVEHLTTTSGWILIASSAYQNKPTRRGYYFQKLVCAISEAYPFIVW